MSTITAIIVDDEVLSIDIIGEYLKVFPQVDVVGKFSNSTKAAAAIIARKPTLVFLDIQMPVMTGFELIESISGHHNPYIIFTTAYDQYAIKAFEVNSIGYLLKPFDREKFGNAVQKFLTHYSDKIDNASIYSGIFKILEERQRAVLEKIMVKDARKIFYIPVSEVVYFEASGDYVKVATEKTTHLINNSLSALEGKLAPEQFIRIHRSFIINANQVKEFIPYFNGEYKIVMANKETVKMSRNYKEDLKKAFPGL